MKKYSKLMWNNGTVDWTSGGTKIVASNWMREAYVFDHGQSKIHFYVNGVSNEDASMTAS